MKNFFAVVLSVIAVGVMLIAYGLLSPRTVAAPYGPDTAAAYASNGLPAYGLSGQTAYASNAPVVAAANYPVARPVPVGEVVQIGDQLVYRSTVASPPIAAPVRTVVTREAPRRTTVRVESKPRRDWRKTALVIGGSSAAGAGLGAIFGGKKGALIGAAIGGGGGTLFEAVKR